MATVRFLGGRRHNLLSRGVVTMYPAASSLYPKENLWDGESEFPARHGSNVAGAYVQVDADVLRGTGNMDSWSGGLPGSQWRKTGTVAADTVVKQAGASSAKISPAGKLEVILECSPGEILGLNGYLRGSGIDVTAMYVQNLQTGKMMNNAGAWVAGSVNCAEVGAAVWTPFNFVTVIEGFGAYRNDVVEILVGFATASADGWADEVTVIPAVDWLSIHGHNVDPRNVLKMRSAPDAAFTGATDRATLAIAPRSFYAWLAPPVIARYWRSELVGTMNSDLSGAPYYGEAILGQSIALSGGVDFPVEILYDRPQARPKTGSGHEGAYPLGPDVTRTLTLKATYGTRAEFDQAYQEVMERTEHGLYPCVMAYDVGADANGDSDLVIFGRLAPSLPVRRAGAIQRSTTFTLQELPLPPATLA